MAVVCLRFTSAAWANLPGGTVTIGNGIVSIVCNTNSGQITTINYTFNNTGSTQTLNLLSGNANGGNFSFTNPPKASWQQGCYRLRVC